MSDAPRPDWLDPALYPFAPHQLELPAGRLHYVDEGAGDPILFVHGTPTWSFLWRDLVRGLAPRYRCVAPDLLGFGLSDKPAGWGYRPRDHAANLEALIGHLGLRALTLVVHDFGGPIGLRYAVEHPDNVRRLILFNTWLWSLRGTRRFDRLGRLISSPLGRLLYTRFGFSPRVMLPRGFADRRRLSRRVHRHYLRPCETPSDRYGTWVLARELLDSGDWYDELWRRRSRLRGKPVLIIWGGRDPAFGPAELARWLELFPDGRLLELPAVGHFPQEEAPEVVLARIREFLARGTGVGSP